MALIKCPDCNSDVSSYAETCPHCGYPIKGYAEKIMYESEIERLTQKIVPFDYKCPEPRVKVCIKCGMPFGHDANPNYIHQNKPECECQIDGKQYPGIDVDYPQAQIFMCDTRKYIFEECVLKHNIGDPSSEEFKKAVRHLEADIQGTKNLGAKEIKCQYPDRRFFGVEVTKLSSELFHLRRQMCPLPPSTSPTINEFNNITFSYAPSAPKCPRCGSTSISTGARGFSWITGFLGSSKTVNRCGNCGHKWEPKR